MSKIRSKDTSPERLVRSLVHALGIRFRLHAKELPGKPDIVLRPRKLAIFVHGCFWHQHSACREGRMPNTRKEYWVPKLMGNVERDKKSRSALRRLGWRVLVVWECETTNLPKLQAKLTRFLEST